jgi:tetratricopeptide (TPR) repeat protein
MNSSRLKLMAAALLLCLTQILPQSAIAEVTGTLQIAQSVPDRKAEADRRLQQGLQQDQTSQFQDALQSYQQALSLYREIGDRAREGAALNNIGSVLVVSGDVEAATKTLFEAVDVLESLRSSELADADKQIGQQSRLFRQPLTP